MSMSSTFEAHATAVLVQEGPTETSYFTAHRFFVESCPDGRAWLQRAERERRERNESCQTEDPDGLTPLQRQEREANSLQETTTGLHQQAVSADILPAVPTPQATSTGEESPRPSLTLLSWPWRMRKTLLPLVKQSPRPCRRLLSWPRRMRKTLLPLLESLVCVHIAGTIGISWSARSWLERAVRLRPEFIPYWRALQES